MTTRVFGLNKKVSRDGLFLGGGGGGVKSMLTHIYLNDYAEFDSKISYRMFLHDYLLTCEISRARTFAFRTSSNYFMTLVHGLIFWAPF